jgi:glutamine synthetase
MDSGLTMACTSDLAGLVRGKGFATGDLNKKIARGVGWTPTNAQITCFDTIAESPYGALGDLVLFPDQDTLAQCALPNGRSMSFLMGDITELDGAPWECCTRSLLKRTLARFEELTGLELRATFEHEFMLPSESRSRAFTLQGFNEAQPFADALLKALEGANIAPDSFLREYGPNQFEVTLPPVPALRAADEATMLREITRSTASAMDLDATFSPLTGSEVVGNGVHIHFSLWTPDGKPVTHDASGQDGLSETASAFIAGILKHLNAVSALTAPSAISAMRLVPHRWSAAYNNLGAQDREAAIRICPVSARDADTRARQFNFEFRAADAAASPYLALAALVAAGTIGVQQRLQADAATVEDLSLLSEAELKTRGLKRLPENLNMALDEFSAATEFLAAFPERFPDIYVAHKLGELAYVADMTDDERYTQYRTTY